MPFRSRNGTVLLLVVGLAATLATLATALIVRMRSEARDSDVVLRYAQARLMLTAANFYLQESSRLGWDMDDATGETFGWTDSRDGALGPRGARPLASGGVRSDGTGLVADAALTIPTWWTDLYGTSPTYRPYFTSADEFDYRPNPTNPVFPRPELRRWPLPGSVVRCDMPVWNRTKYAIKPIFSANPFRPPVAYGDPTWQATWTATPGMNPAWLPDTFNPDQGAIGMLDPQPVAESWSAFRAGDPTLRPGSQGLVWFRVYRELLSDHDNDPKNDDDYGILGGNASEIEKRSIDRVALYDRTDNTSRPPLRNYSVFIIAVGSGGSRGYRFWHLLHNDPRRALEPVTASESFLFPNEEVFNLIRQNEIVQWFRVEHTARGMPQLGVDSLRTRSRGNDSDVNTPDFTYPWNNWNLIAQHRPALSLLPEVPTDTPGGSWSIHGHYHAMPPPPIASFGGGFRWVQRLAREPIKW
jgi:hypothetical protein